MFAILDKKDILDVKAGDKKDIDCILLSHALFNFDDIEKMIVSKEEDRLSNIIKFVDWYFNIFYAVLKEKEGSLLSNELNLKKIEAVFLKDERQAIDFAIDVVKRLSAEAKLKKLTKFDSTIIIYKANILYSIVGEKSRALPFVVSVARNEINEILLNFESSGAKVIITEDIKNALKDPLDLNLRFVGYSLINNKTQKLPMYEVLDCCDIVEREQKESSLSGFRKALDLFYKFDFYAARNEFSNVISPLDNVARWYLFLCDKYWRENQIDKDLNGNLDQNENKGFNLALYGDKDIKIY